jgi:hypothetical protein
VVPNVPVWPVEGIACYYWSWSSTRSSLGMTM